MPLIPLSSCCVIEPPGFRVRCRNVMGITVSMTAGRGVIHSELPPEDFLESGGMMHGFQIWV
ncbi:MAG TPA: hypothetical protein EYM66_01110, partial [Candidatus Poseidoniales archaeon]|nr:hypothetical protein [Candidatus Poseidoniales archaeon]